MNTFTHPVPAVKRQLYARLTIEIDVTVYGVELLHPDPRVACHAFRLTKPNGEGHDVAIFGHGPECTCGDYVFRQSKTGGICKHISGLQAVGLLPGSRDRQPAA